MKQEKVTEKVCRRCGETKPIEMFRARSFGFILNQCKSCEKELGKIRRESKNVLSITTRSGKIVKASLKPIKGGRITTSHLSDKVLYFDSSINRDLARIAFSAYADVPRTGIQFKTFN